MKAVYWEAVGGISGDMLTAAMLDAAPQAEEYLVGALKTLKINPWEWSNTETTKGAFRARKIDFLIDRGHHHRHLPDIEVIIKGADFTPEVKDRILAAFEIMAVAESKAHGIPKEEVHFHEVGADDSILDISAVTLLLDYLGIEAVFASPLPIGGGVGNGCHGIMPHPAPALNHLLEGVSVVGIEEQVETVTPTGAVLLKANKAKFGPLPAMTIEKIGCGCGTRDTERPNILRCFLGESSQNAANNQIIQLEFTIDDMTGEDVGALWDKIFAAGATDVHITPVYMKKCRPGQKITVLTTENNLEKVRDAIFRHTTTIGMTCRSLERFVLKREVEPLATPIGTIDIKKSAGYGVDKAKPEFEQLAAAAEKEGISLAQARNIVAAAMEEKSQGKDGE